MSMLRYDFSKTGITKSELSYIARELTGARDRTFDDIACCDAGGEPEDRHPCDCRFIDMPRRLLEAYRKDGDSSELGRILNTAGMIRERTDRVVLLGIGGSSMGPRAIFSALCHPFHNEQPRANRIGADGRPIPRIYFEGDNVDNRACASLLEMMDSLDPSDASDDWCCVPISKSGGTLETAVATRLFLNSARKRYGDGSEKLQKFFVPVTGKSSSKLRALAEQIGVREIFEVPDGVGGRFSVLSAVGLLPAAIMGVDVVALLEGAVAMTEHFRSAAVDENMVLQYLGVNHLLETRRDLNVRILSTWGKSFEYVGLWLDQLVAESLGKDFLGSLPLTCVNTRDLHSRGQQHQQGALDKSITNLFESPTAIRNPLTVGESDRDEDHLNRFATKTYPEILDAARRGTNEAYQAVQRPTADLSVSTLCAESLGELFQFFMTATVAEGELLGVNPYGQPGVEAYKINMQRILSEE
ncbi:MAG: glucose-6-phosphate isomerase [Planctomycetia bacterium]|nr:glucose-6-phosphate isomerase [Planctomycetia bacterium]